MIPNVHMDFRVWSGQCWACVAINGALSVLPKVGEEVSLCGETFVVDSQRHRLLPNRGGGVYQEFHFELSLVSKVPLSRIQANNRIKSILAYAQNDWPAISYHCLLSIKKAKKRAKKK